MLMPSSLACVPHEDSIRPVPGDNVPSKTLGPGAGKEACFFG